MWKETDTDKKGNPFREMTAKKYRRETAGRGVFKLTSDQNPDGSGAACLWDSEQPEYRQGGCLAFTGNFEDATVSGTG